MMGSLMEPMTDLTLCLPMQVSQCYPKDTQGFTAEVIQLLDTHYALLDPALRRGLVKALILLRNKGQLTPTELHPLFFRLFRCQDKDLRQMLFRHIIAGAVKHDHIGGEK